MFCNDNVAVTDCEIANAIAKGNGIKWIDFCSNDALCAFYSFVNDYYVKHSITKNEIDCVSDEYELSQSIVAMRLMYSWKISSKHDDICTIVISFANQLHDMLNAYDNETFSICYELVVRDVIPAFVSTFGVGYSL